jgi:hypothetical protein
MGHWLAHQPQKQRVWILNPSRVYGFYGKNIAAEIKTD